MQLDRTPPYSSLLLLKTLCEKRNLAAAAEVLGLSASSASRHLSEMRELFDDKLFTRFPGGLVPTRRALEIAAQSEPILDGYAALMRPARFNPAEMTREVCIGCADNAPFSLFPKFADCLLQQAPNITISFPKSRSKPSRYSSENDVLIEKSVKYTDFFLLSIVYV